MVMVQHRVSSTTTSMVEGSSKVSVEEEKKKKKKPLQDFPPKPLLDTFQTLNSNPSNWFNGQQDERRISVAYFAPQGEECPQGGCASTYGTQDAERSQQTHLQEERN